MGNQCFDNSEKSGKWNGMGEIGLVTPTQVNGTDLVSSQASRWPRIADWYI